MSRRPSDELIYGVGPIGERLRAQPDDVLELFVARGARERVAELAAAARVAGVRVSERSRAELARMAGEGARHQGAVARVRPFDYADLDALLAAARERDEPPLVVALDGVQDPHNLGAVVRSAYLFGGHGVVIPRDRAVGVTPAVVKTSAGAVGRLGIARVTNLARALEQLQQAGLWVAAVATAPDAIAPWELDLSGPTCLVLGAEGRGIRPLIARIADHHIAIPMAGDGVGSFNVSVAAGAVLYETARQRRSA